MKRKSSGTGFSASPFGTYSYFGWYNAPIFDEGENRSRTLTAADVEAGAVQPVSALKGTYTDARGNQKPVNGGCFRTVKAKAKKARN